MSSRSKYQVLKETWSNPTCKEKFFVSYAVEGPMVAPEYGLRQSLPVDHPICGPVQEPSPLNTRWKYNPPNPSINAIL
jgi:hypothetical protein